MVLEGDFSRTLLSSWRGEKLIMLDSWDHVDGYNHDRMSDLNIAKSRVAPFEGRYEFLKSTSTSAVENFPDGYFDYIYLDAAHTCIFFVGCFLTPGWF